MKTPTPANDNAPPGDGHIEFQAIRIEKLADRTVIGGTAKNGKARSS